MSSGKTKKYLAYAIGEIILVVIGILIALQINNWNEGKKLKKEESISLLELHEEAENIVANLRKSVKRKDSMIHIIDLTSKAFANNSILNIDKNTATFGINATGHYEALRLPNSVYSELNSSGKLQNIKSTEVKKSVSQYYSRLEFINGQLPYWRDTYTLDQDFHNSNLLFVYDASSKNRSRPDFDFAKLAIDPIFKSKLTEALRNQIVFQGFRKNLLKSAQEMCATLADELSVECSSK